MIYALIAFGYSLTFSTSRTINFSLGNLLMLGGVVGFSLAVDMASGQSLGRPFLVPLIGVLIAGTLAGSLVYKTAVQPSLRTKTDFTWVLATLAFGIILKNAVEQIWSTGDFRLPSPLGDSVVHLGSIGFYPQEVLIIIVSLLLMTAVELIRSKTIWGKAVQAVSEDPATASLMGINPQGVVHLAYILSAVIAAIGGLLIAPLTFVSASMGTAIGIKAYAAAIIGGLESGLGIVVGGLILGLGEVFTARYLSTGYKDTPGFVLLILIILVRPSGLFGRTKAKKV